VSPIRAHTKERKETIKETHQLFEFVDPFIDYMIKVKKNKAPEKTKSLIEKSIDTIDKLIRLDGFELEYIKKVSRWAVKDDFWSIAFFSLAPLRKKVITVQPSLQTWRQDMTANPATQSLKF
jgi:hypothetical protein